MGKMDHQHSAAYRLLIGLFIAASLSAQTFSVRTYTVNIPAVFPPLSLPANSLLFRNGAYQLAGTNYTFDGTNFTFPPGVLVVGDKLSVVTMTPTPQIPLLSGTGIMIVTEPSTAVTTATALNISTIAADTVFLSYLTLPPTGPGPCVQTNTPTFNESAGAWATDSGYFYFCVTAPPGSTGSSAGLVWARIQYATTW
jgi:hypothetical protein